MYTKIRCRNILDLKAKRKRIKKSEGTDIKIVRRYYFNDLKVEKKCKQNPKFLMLKENTDTLDCVVFKNSYSSKYTSKREREIKNKRKTSTDYKLSIPTQNNGLKPRN